MESANEAAWMSSRARREHSGAKWELDPVGDKLRRLFAVIVALTRAVPRGSTTESG